MAMFFGTALFFGIIACTVPYFYAYCNQNSDIPVEITEKEEESENKEEVHSLRVKEGKDFLEIQTKKKMKDVSVNTIETIASDATSYKKLATSNENFQEQQEEIFHTPPTQTFSATIFSKDSSCSPARTRKPINVQALIHAENPNSVTFAQESLDEKNIFQTSVNNLNKNGLLKKRQFFKKDKSAEQLKKFWTRVKSRGFSRSSSSEESKKKSLSTGYLSSTSEGIRTSTGISSEENNSSTANFQQNQLPLGNSTFRDSKQKLALKFHDGIPTIFIETPSTSSNSLSISVVDLTSPGHLNVPQSQSNIYLLVSQETPSSSDEDNNLNKNISFNRL